MAVHTLKCTAVWQEENSERWYVGVDWNTEHYEVIFDTRALLEEAAEDQLSTPEQAARMLLSYWKARDSDMSDDGNLVNIELRANPSMNAIALALSAPTRRLVWTVPII